MYISRICIYIAEENWRRLNRCLTSMFETIHGTHANVCTQKITFMKRFIKREKFWVSWIDSLPVAAISCGRYFFQKAHWRALGPEPTSVVFVSSVKYSFFAAVWGGQKASVQDPSSPMFGSLTTQFIRSIDYWEILFRILEGGGWNLERVKLGIKKLTMFKCKKADLTSIIKAAN